MEMLFSALVILFFLLIAMVAIWMYQCFVVVKAPGMGYTTWFGKPYRPISPGIHFLWWPLENLHQYYWTRTDATTSGEGVLCAYRGSFVSSAERIYDPPQYEITTKDDLLIIINVLISYRIEDIYKAFFNVMDLYRSMEQVLSTSVVEKASSMTLEEAIDGKDEIQEYIFKIFSGKTEDWGVSITRVDIQSINSSRTIVDAKLEMDSEEKRLGAELRRRKATHEYELSNIEREIEKQAKEHEKARAEAIHKAELVRTEADSKMYQKMKESESELALWKARADGKKAEVEGLKGTGLSDEALTEYVKWKALENMPNVQFIPTEALGLMKATRLYHHLEASS